jgi:hypothetical protein
MTDDEKRLIGEIVKATLAPAWADRDRQIRGRSQRYTLDEAALRSTIEDWVGYALVSITPRVIDDERSRTADREAQWEATLGEAQQTWESALRKRDEEVVAHFRSEGLVIEKTDLIKNPTTGALDGAVKRLIPLAERLPPPRFPSPITSPVERAPAAAAASKASPPKAPMGFGDPRR